MFLVKTLAGLKPACETSEAFARKVGVGEVIEVECKTRNTRSVQWHRRYFGLLRLIYSNTERFRSEDDVHFYLKAETGTFDSVVLMPHGTEPADVSEKMLDIGVAEFVKGGLFPKNASPDEMAFMRAEVARCFREMHAAGPAEKAYFVKSIAFDKMTAEEWPKYWERALDVLFTDIMPGIDRDEALLEIERCAGYAR